MKLLFFQLFFFHPRRGANKKNFADFRHILFFFQCDFQNLQEQIKRKRHFPNALYLYGGAYSASPYAYGGSYAAASPYYYGGYARSYASPYSYYGGAYASPYYGGAYASPYAYGGYGGYGRYYY